MTHTRTADFYLAVFNATAAGLCFSSGLWMPAAFAFVVSLYLFVVDNARKPSKTPPAPAVPLPGDPSPADKAKAQRMFTILTAAGFAPFKVAESPMFGAIGRAYLDGSYDDAAVIRAVTNLDIFAGGRLRSKVEPGLTDAVQANRN